MRSLLAFVSMFALSTAVAFADPPDDGADDAAPAKAAAPAEKAAPKNANTPVTPKAKAAKLSYNDARALAELPAKIDLLTSAIARHEAVLADPALYTRDPKRFASVMAELDRVRADLAAAEEQWLVLAEKEAALAG